MKFYWFFIGISLFAWQLTPVSAGSFAAQQATEKGNKPDPADSLLILDSLVNATKVSDNNLSIRFAEKALTIARRMNSPESMSEAFKLMGIAYNQTQKDSSYFYFNLALKIADSAGLWKQKIQILYNLAMLYNAAYDYKTAMTLLDSAIILAESITDYSTLAYIYNELGNIKSNINDIPDALRMYERALQIARKNSLYRQMGVSMSNLAKFEEDIRKSITLNKEALTYLQKEYGTEEEMAYILINIGNGYSMPDSAIFYYKRALKLITGGNLPEVEIGAYNNMAYSYLDKGDLQMAETCLKDHAIPLAIKEKNYDWLSTLYDSYADVCIAQGDYKEAISWQKQALKEKLVADTQQAHGQVRLLAALLDLKNKELKIQKEERELLIQRNRLQRAELWIAILGFVAVVSVFLILWLQQRNRMKLQHQQISSAKRIIELEESEKGRTARELHDITGQLVMGVTGALENLDLPDDENKAEIKEKIKELGSSIRHISHRMNPAMIEHFTFNELITGLCEDMQRLSGMPVRIEVPDDNPELPRETVLHFYRISQELLTNASKYARDSEVSIKVTADNKNKMIKLFYSDTGPGFEMKGKNKAGMGIMNIFERVKLIGGEAIVNTTPGKGTSWEISFPVDRRNIALT